MRRQAFDNLVAAGTNALVVAGLSLRYDDVSEEQRTCLCQTDEDGVCTTFDIDGVASCAASRPSGCGEERIVVLYDSTDLQVARQAVRCAFYRKPGLTFTKVTLERKRGPYIMDTRMGRYTLSCSRAHEQLLSRVPTVAPMGYALRGPFIF